MPSQSSFSCLVTFIVVIAAATRLRCSLAFPRCSVSIPPHRTINTNKHNARSGSSCTIRRQPLFALPENYQEQGRALICQAASLCGVSHDQLDVEWKSGRIVVVVKAANAYLSDPFLATDSNDGILEDDEEYEDEEEFFLDEGQDHFADEESSISATASDDDAPMDGVDVTLLARAINAAFDDDGIGATIAELHAIEVTTPGASEELVGPVMFNAYRGFDVIVQHVDPKKKATKTIEGRLMERNNEFTVFNIKGRLKTLQNDSVVSVKLPKAKKEKGAQ
jgi:ribosome maturation factor RimP